MTTLRTPALADMTTEDREILERVARRMGQSVDDPCYQEDRWSTLCREFDSDQFRPLAPDAKEVRWPKRGQNRSANST